MVKEIKSQGKSSAGARPVGRQAFELADNMVRPGSIGRMELPVSRLPTGTWLTLPIAVVHGRTAGPTIWLSAAIHGDELNGVPIIRKVLRTIKPAELAGTLIAVPVVNVFGLITESRYLPDRRDLNRCFPGSKRGSMGARLAYLFMNEVVRRCEFGIDLHTGSNGRTNLPQIRCDVDDPRTRELAECFGAPVTVHANLRDGSLRAAARHEDIKVLLYEAGEAGRLSQEAIGIGVQGVFRVMHAMGMLKDAVAPPDEPTEISRTTSWIRVGRTGFCEIRVGLGERVSAGQEIAVTYDTLGLRQVKVRADRDGIVIGHLQSALLSRGGAVVHLAEV